MSAPTATTLPALCEECGEESCGCVHCVECGEPEDECTCPAHCYRCDGSGLPSQGPLDVGRCIACGGRGVIERRTE